MVDICTLHTTWGWLGLATSELGVRILTLPKPTEHEASHDLRAELGSCSARQGTAPAKIADELRRYFAGEVVSFQTPLDLPTQPAFWRKVWDVVAAIPYGHTASYGEVARRAGAPKASRAVGGAMAHNPVPLLVPCHRVVGSDGRLTGFGGGLDLKRRLLALEREAAPRQPS